MKIPMGGQSKGVSSMEWKIHDVLTAMRVNGMVFFLFDIEHCFGYYVLTYEMQDYDFDSLYIIRNDPKRENIFPNIPIRRIQILNIYLCCTALPYGGFACLYVCVSVCWLDTKHYNK